MANISHQYLRPIKAARRQGMLDCPFPAREDLKLWQGTNATILPLREVPDEDVLFGRGGVVDSQGNYVDLSGILYRVRKSYPFESPAYEDKKVVYCGYLPPQWGHFLVEGVARLWYFLENDPTIDKYVFFVEEDSSREIQGNYRIFLELLGIWDRLEIISKPTTYREILVPEVGYLSSTYYAPKYRAVFDRVAENVVPKPGWTPAEKVYFSRSQFRKNGELEEFGYDALDNFFVKNGYTILFPEQVPLDHLIYYIRNCKKLATYSGSVAHNVLFGRQGMQVDILEHTVFNDDNQADIDRIRDLNATYVDVVIPLYPTHFGGPFVEGFNDNMERFAADNGYLPPDSQFLTEKYRRELFAGYMRAYWNQFRYRWFMMDWNLNCADYLWEGYQAGYAYFKEYMDGEKPFFWYQHFQPHYFKQFLKRALRKLGLYHG